MLTALKRFVPLVTSLFQWHRSRTDERSNEYSRNLRAPETPNQRNLAPPKNSSPLINDPIARQLRKLEIKVHMAHAGPSELLRLLVIVSALPVGKSSKPEYRLKIY
jgi:hypothetical protein